MNGRYPRSRAGRIAAATLAQLEERAKAREAQYEKDPGGDIVGLLLEYERTQAASASSVDGRQTA